MAIANPPGTEPAFRAPRRPGPDAPDGERFRYAQWLELCRRRFVPFVVHCYPGLFEVFPETRVVAEALEQFFEDVRRHLSPRVLIKEPPRVGKSELVSRMFPCWVLGQEPDWHYGIVSYGDDLAWELSADARTIIQSEEYAEVFGATFKDPDDPTEDVVELDPNGKSVKHWKIRGKRGGLRAAGINGALTGKGFHILDLDDPTKGRKEADSKDYRDEQWSQFKGTFYPRLEPGGGILLMGTPWHIDDVMGRVLKENDENEAVLLADHWKVIHIPAQAIPGQRDPLGRAPGEWMGGRRTPGEWEHLKANTDPREWAAQYLGMPLPDEGQIFHPRDQFLFQAPPSEDQFGKPFRGARYGFIDSSHAKSRESDYSALGIFQVEPDLEIDGEAFRVLGILDMFRSRWQYPELKRHSKKAYTDYGLWGMVIEDYSAGRALGQEFKRDSGMKVVMYRPDRDKYARAHAATSALQTGLKKWKIRVPSEERFPSGLPVRIFLDELQNFQPGGEEHDDQVDVFTTAVIMICVRDQSNRRIELREFAFA